MYYINEHIKDLYRVKFHDERGSVLRLDMNENPAGLPPDFAEAVKKKITPEFLATYPEKDRLVKLIAGRNKIPEDCVSITSGSDEAVRLIFQCFGEQGKSLVTVSPTFEMYGVYGKMFGMNHAAAEYTSHFTVSAETLLDLIGEKTGIVVLLNPNSPIGTAFTEGEAAQIIEKAAANDAIVVIDEAYHYFYETSFMPFTQKYRNVIVLRTFSKLFSIAGLRVGYAAADSQIIRYIENAQSTFNVNNTAILFAEELLMRPDIIDGLKKDEREGHIWLENALIEAGYKLFSANGNFLLFMPKRPSAEIISELKKRGVWVRDYSRGVLSGWVRVSTGHVGCMKKFWELFREVDR